MPNNGRSMLEMEKIKLTYSFIVVVSCCFRGFTNGVNNIRRACKKHKK
jgi:hypothetical protein